MTSAETLEKSEELLDVPYKLTKAQIQSFRENGHIRLKDVLSPELLAHYRKEFQEEVSRSTTDLPPLEERDTYGQAFLQVFNLWERNEVAERLVKSKRLARIAAELLEVAGVRLYHDQALFKEAGGGATPWHADQAYWPLEGDRTVTVWIPLQKVPLEMGPLSFCSGSHRSEEGRKLLIGDDSEREIADLVASSGLPTEEAAFDLGEVSFHLGWTLHRAPANQTDQMRAVMTMIYMDAEIRTTAPNSSAQENDLKSWLESAAPGQIPSGQKNPLLFQG